MLVRTAHSGNSPYQPSSHACYHADGNGNVTYLLKSDRTHGASYKYDPYGKLVASSGSLAAPNTLRFSSKQWHEHASIYYYGCRFYVPELQRWLNRDPIGENGGINLYGFVGNNPLGSIDPNGEGIMDVICFPKKIRDAMKAAEEAKKAREKALETAGDPESSPEETQKTADEARQKTQDGLEKTADAAKSAAKMPGTISGGGPPKPQPR